MRPDAGSPGLVEADVQLPDWDRIRRGKLPQRQPQEAVHAVVEMAAAGSPRRSR